MKNNDITYEYRVFTNRLIDVEHMEVGKCTSKVIENLKSKDKVDGRFFHTSDKNEWYFCWDGKLQKLNLSGDASVNDALAQVEKLIGDVNKAVEQAQDAITKADAAAESATNAAESINGKADLDYVDSEIATVNSIATAAKATADEVESKVDELSSLVEELPSSKDIVTTSDLNDYAKTSDLEDYAKSSDLDGVIKSTDLESYATKEYVDNKLLKKQDKIDDIDDIRSNAAKGAAAEANANSYTNSKSKEVLNAAKMHSENLTNIYDAAGAADAAKNEVITYAAENYQVKGDYALKTEIPSTDNFATKQDVADAKDWVNQQGFLTEETLKNSTVISDINSQISEINTLLGDVKSYIKDTILA